MHSGGYKKQVFQYSHWIFYGFFRVSRLHRGKISMNTHFTTNNASSSANKKLSWYRQLRPQISCVSVNGSLMVKVNKTNRSIRILISFIGNHRKIPLLYGNFKLPSLLWEYAFYGLKALSFCSAISGFMAKKIDTKSRFRVVHKNCRYFIFY